MDVARDQVDFKVNSGPACSWSGRGRQPRWVADGIAQRKTLNDIACQRKCGV
ncbi:MAG: H-NS family nucleoid-associated regulatory protein [Telluria sp.]